MNKPERDKKYLEWITTLPCILTGYRPTVAHHQWKRHEKAMGSKCSDYRAVPLCHEIHTLFHGDPGWKVYDWYGVDIEEVIKTLNAWWELFHIEKKRRPLPEQCVWRGVRAIKIRGLK